MLPFLAQGAATAIEDAYVLAARLAETSERPEVAFRRYGRARQRRTARVQRAARFNSRVYHLRGLLAWLRNQVLRRRGGMGLLRRYDWLYAWRP
jgi:salicylate hydroxylase